MKNQIYILILFLITFSIRCQGQNFNLDETSSKALFIYNFTKYFEWKESTNPEFVIGVVGQSFIADKLKSLVQTKNVNGKKISVKTVKDQDEIANCAILFVPKEESFQIASLAKELKATGILLISENKGMIQKGSAINFIEVENKINFEICKSSLENLGLKADVRILSFAARVASNFRNNMIELENSECLTLANSKQ